MSRRLESLEAALAETQDTIKRLVSGTAICTDTFATLQPAHSWPTPEETTPTLHETAVFKRPLGHFLRSHDVEGSERYFNPTSLESLVYDIRDLFLEPLANGGSENQNVRECALLAQHKLDDLVSRNKEIIRNGAPPTAPPISILKAMIEPYFATVNPHFPIWTKDSFMRIATALQETNHVTQDLGLVVCSNNLILMALAANLSQIPSHQDKPRQSRSVRSGSSINMDLMNGFLANAKRAIEYAELLLAPRLINVQALLSLCVVAQEHMSPSVFARLFNLTAQCAKSIGVHDWETLEGDEGDRERQRLSYCLYILDKVVCSTAGTSPYIPASDVHIDTATKSYGDRIMSDLVARAKLAEIQETIYLEIYARRAPSRTADQVRLLVSKFDQKLHDWTVSSGVDLAEIDSDAFPSSAPKIELSIGFACTQLLYMRPFKEHPDVAFQIIEVARRGMKLLVNLGCSAGELEHQGALSSIIASYPPLYVFEICSYVLSGEGQDSDVNMLQSFTEMLHDIADLRAEESHNHRLYEACATIVDVITAIKSPHKRRKLQHSSSLSSSQLPSIETQRLFPYSPSSDVPPNNNDNNNSSSQAQIRNQGNTSLAVSNFEPLMSPTNSRGCPEDELVTLMGPLGKGPFEPFDLLGYSGAQISRGESLIEKDLWWD
ncbi:hypothetical protein Hte_005185 [Hypoxylon texense]